MATHSSVLAWRIPRTGKPGGLLSMGLHRVGHDPTDLAAAAAAASLPSLSLLTRPVRRLLLTYLILRLVSLMKNVHHCCLHFRNTETKA